MPVEYVYVLSGTLYPYSKGIVCVFIRIAEALGLRFSLVLG